MEKAVCPHCQGEYNRGAAVCYTCQRYISWKTWLRMNWPGILLYAVPTLGIVALMIGVDQHATWADSFLNWFLRIE